MYNDAYSNSVDRFHNSIFGRNIDTYVAETCTKLITPSNKTKLVEFGCNQGALLYKLKNLYDVYGYDITKQDSVSADHIKSKILQADFNLRLPISTSSFDLAVSTNVLEHITNIHLFMSEVSRSLKPGGYFVNIVPLEPSFLRGISNLRTTWVQHKNEGFLKVLQFARKYHVRIYRLYLKLLKDEMTVKELAAGTDFEVVKNFTGIRFLYGPWISIVLRKKSN